MLAQLFAQPCWEIGQGAEGIGPAQRKKQHQQNCQSRVQSVAPQATALVATSCGNSSRAGQSRHLLRLFPNFLHCKTVGQDCVGSQEEKNLCCWLLANINSQVWLTTGRAKFRHKLPAHVILHFICHQQQDPETENYLLLASFLLLLWGINLFASSTNLELVREPGLSWLSDLTSSKWRGTHFCLLPWKVNILLLVILTLEVSAPEKTL